MDRFKFRAWIWRSRGGHLEYGVEHLNYWLEHDYPVMQSIGRRDKNDVLIYTGDVVSVPYYGSMGPPKIVEVSMDDVECHPFNTYSNSEDGYSEPEDSEIIGNIHENPHLLEAKNGS